MEADKRSAEGLRKSVLWEPQISTLLQLLLDLSSLSAMSLLSHRSACLPGPSSSLFALLGFLLLLMPPTLLAEADSDTSVVRELRCICLTVTPGVSPAMIADLKVIAVGQQCPEVQVIASLKNGKEVCLDPDAPVIKKIIKKILDRNKKSH